MGLELERTINLFTRLLVNSSTRLFVYSSTRLLDFVAPRMCVMCGKRLSTGEEYVCGVCQLHIPRTFFHLKPLDNIMAQMFWGQMPIERATAMFLYQPQSNTSKIVYNLKYSHKPEIGIVMGRMMANEVMASGFFEGIDLIIPVPLAPNRMKQRGYNQSAMLAQGISEISGIKLNSHIVIRKGFKESQTRLNRHSRMENVNEQFVLATDGGSLTDKHILIVDDVATTGATVIACAAAFKGIEGIRFSVMTLAFTHS